MTGPLLELRDVIVEAGDPPRRVVDRLSLQIHPGERVALAGPSGSGKSLTTLAIVDLLGPAARLTSGSVCFEGRELSPQQRRALRGKDVALVFQDPLAALNPVHTAGAQVEEALRVVRGLDAPSARRRAAALLDRVKLPPRAATAYPHQLSGGMRQRVMIALALALEPKLLIADEPTTALDAITETEVMDLLLEASEGRALLLISHDLALVRQRCTRAYIVDAGSVVEHGAVGELWRTPQHPRTRALLEAYQPPASPLPPADAAPILQVRGLTKRFSSSGPAAVDGVSFDLSRGETLALVGESGAGKSTLARCVLRLADGDAGEIVLCGLELHRLRGRALLPVRRRVQLVAQDPSGALDPRLRAGDAVIEGLLLHGMKRREAQGRVAELFSRVELPLELAERFPHQLSGGERQRVALARALALSPEVLILDEPLSALDVELEARLVALLARLQASLRTSLLWITHDLRLVRRIAQRVAVMHEGRLVELGDTAAVLAAPRHPYTRALVAAHEAPAS